MNTFKMTKKGNVKETDVDGSVVNKYNAVPYTNCGDCAFNHHDDCTSAGKCTGGGRLALGLPEVEVHFVLKVKKPKAVVPSIYDVLVAAGLSLEDAKEAQELCKDKRPERHVSMNPAEILWSGFIWVSSPKGHSYWSKLASKLQFEGK